MACQIDAYKTMLGEFIELYRSMPCLWKVNAKEYNDRHKKDRAYDVLANKLKEVDPTSNRDKVVKKINNMRTSFRKELKKYLKSKETETNPEDVYRPKLWYFDSLLFLVETDENGEKGQKSSTSFLNEQDGNQEGEEDEADSQQDPFALMKISAPFTEPLTLTQPKEEVEENYQDHDEDQPEYETTSMNNKRSASLTEDDECDQIGKYVAAKLRKLSPVDALIAEKRINDVLFDIQMKCLTERATRSRSNINEDP